MRGQQIALWDNSGTQLACMDGGWNRSGTVSVNYSGLTIGQTYYISVDEQTTRGSFSLCMYDTLDYDFHDFAKTITHAASWCSTDAEYSNYWATADETAGGCWAGGTSRNVWFKFAAQGEGLDITIQTGGSYGSMRGQQIALWDAVGTQLACMDGGWNRSGAMLLSYSGLTVGQTYYISVDEQTTRGSFTLCMQDDAARWTGSVDSDWSNTGNWDSGTIPTASTYVVIPENPAGGAVFPTTNSGSDALSKNIYIEAGAYLSVPSGKTLSVAENLVLKSNASKTAAIIDLNTTDKISVAGTVQAERYLSKDDYHYISTPVSGLNTSLFTDSHATYAYNETAATDNWLYGWYAPSGSLTNAKGYALYYKTDYTLNFDGSTLNSGDYSIGISLTSGSEAIEKRGWNLVGNPYPSAIDADLFIAENAGAISGTLYFWANGNNDGAYESSDYASWNGAGSTSSGGSIVPNGFIGSNQGFMVKANGNANINFKNSMRAVNNTQFFKKRNETITRLKLSINNENYYSEALIAFKDDASDEYDYLYDGLKLRANGSISIYTEMDSQPYGIQAFKTLPKDLKYFAVPVTYEASEAGKCSILVKEFENFKGISVYLRDKFLNTGLVLNSGKEYNFVTEAGIFQERFEVVFSSRKAAPIPAVTSDILIYPNPNRGNFKIVVNSRDENYVSEIYSITGKLIYRNKFSTSEAGEIELGNQAPGIYLVKIISDKKVSTKRIFVK